RTGEGWAGTVLRTEHLGSESYIYIDIGSGEPMIARTPGTTAFASGDAVVMTAGEGDILRFDSAGMRLN
ncbi:MAG: sugar transporter ATP-binding protein, partial [Devosia sp.]|nr:sugar transporter ATP-binding protein [Devosia sp.]